MNFNKKILLFLPFLLTGVSFASNVLALITNWPPSPFPPHITLTNDSTLTDMVRYFYEWGIFLGGLAVAVALLIGGFLYLTSAGDPGRLKEAKDRIFSALTGLVLLLSIFLILRTINPQLTVLIPPDLLSPEAMMCDCAPETVPCSDCKNSTYFKCIGDSKAGDGNKEGMCTLISGETCSSDGECQEKFGASFICDPSTKTCVQSFSCSTHCDCVKKFGYTYQCIDNKCVQGATSTIQCLSYNDCKKYNEEYCTDFDDCVGGGQGTSTYGVCVDVD
jgi:hypothetical protein